jgi:hypothetical protein
MKRFERMLCVIACALVGSLFIYVVSLGPLAGLALRNRSPSMLDPHWLDVAFKPIQSVLCRMPEPMARAYSSYLAWWIETLHR